ncbi:Testis-expressed sequence 38 protein [Sciurus carolinensis]|uniref:Testis-expressed sequence 38 protein n=1 Tax=Sciurus carolinensis TaxID=30640 RepID=A0AA41MSY8_SCICA|nr:Testis-expressed sequence 38 protein [Sciurus carolinensis]
MESLSVVKSEPLHQHQPWNAQCSEPGETVFRQQWALGLPKAPIGGQILGAVDTLLSHGPGNKSQRYGSSNVKPGPCWHPLLYWINMQKLHSIKATIQIGPPTAVTISEMKDHIPHCLWESTTPEARGYGLRGSMRRAEIPGDMKSALAVSGQPTSNRMPQRHTTSPFPIPILQEIPFAPPLHKMSPMLEHTVSYPLDIYPERNIHYHSLPNLALE